MAPVTWIPAIVAAVLGDHLWQSALVVPLAVALSLALGRQHAHLRYGLWLVASLKFLVPFAPLIALGRWLAAGWPAVAPAQASLLIETVARPLSGSDWAPALTNVAATAGASRGRTLLLLLFIVWASGAGMLVIAWAVRWRRIAAAVRAGSRLDRGREAAMLRQVEAAARCTRSATLVVSDTAREPGVFGLFAPTLVWPRRLSERLTDAQVAAIFAHELCHIRRRDNLAAAIHMLVQAMFWMHPLVWWLGARLMEEREHACDEEVLRLGNEPHAYAEGILATCRFSLESPLACVAGVTGADLQARLVRILRRRHTDTLTFFHKALLAGFVLGLITGPIAVGIVTAPRPAGPVRTGGGALETLSMEPGASRSEPWRERAS